MSRLTEHEPLEHEALENDAPGNKHEAPDRGSVARPDPLRQAGARDAVSHQDAKAIERQADAFRLLDLLIVLARGRRMVLRSTLAAAALAALVAFLLPTRYTATTSILPPQQSQSLAASMIGQLGALGPLAAMAQKDLGLKNPNDMYVGLLRSRTLEDALIRRFDLERVYGDRKMSDARRDLEKASEIVLGKEGFIAISVEDKDRRRAAQMANAYVEELRQLTQDLAVTEAGERRLFFERELDTAKNNLSQAEQDLKRTEQKTGMIQLEGQARAIIDAVVKLRAEIAAKEVELEAMRLSATEENPDLRRREQQLSAMRSELARMERQSNGPANLQVPAGNVPEAGLEYVRKLREVKYAEAIFEILAKQYEAARLDEAKTAAVIQVLDPALEPDRKSSPPRAWIVALAALLGFSAASAYVLVAEAFRRLQSDSAAARRWTALKETVSQPRF